MSKTSAKECPKCGNTSVVKLISTNQKICGRCSHQFEWYLEEGQRSLMSWKNKGGK